LGQRTLRDGQPRWSVAQVMKVNRPAALLARRRGEHSILTEAPVWRLFAMLGLGILAAIGLLVIDGADRAAYLLFGITASMLALVALGVSSRLRVIAWNKAVRAAVVDSALDSVITIDRRGKVLEFNPAATATFGYSREDAVGRDLADLIIPPSLRDKHRQGLARLDQGESDRILGRRIELTGLRADGSEFPVELTVTRISAKPPMYAGHVRDISDRREHGRQRELLSAIVQSSTDAIISTTPDGIVTSWNPGAERAYGLSSTEACGKPLGDLIVPPHIAGDERGIINQVLAGESVELHETERLRTDGRVLHVAVSAAPIKDSDGGIAGVSLIERDITERKRRELEMLHDVEEYNWLQRIRKALDEDLFHLYAQPIIDLRTGEVSREEILIRMGGDRGDADIILPGEFLPTAEKFDLVGDIDRWVMRNVMPLLSAGRNLSVNVSGRSIGDPAITKSVESLLKAHGADPARLTIEITETAAVRDLHAARVFADRLERLGCGLALDDFGTGYGSFTYLKHIPVQYMKIDLQFIRDLVHTRSDQRVVRSMIGVAKSFGVKTIAEGIENPDTLELLKVFGIDYGQGFHIGRPVPALSQEVASKVTPERRVGVAPT
jgi:PAS domain S-box-containing protein